ncbi:hypothetical protein LCGC14_1089400, partial [marine sediment metagenome]
MSMSATSEKSRRKTSKATAKCICSPALAAGQEPSSSPDGLPTDLLGQPVVPVRRSPSPARKRHARRAQARVLCGALDELVTQYARTAATLGLPTPATYGRKFGGSQPSEGLNSFLANRLKASMPSTGSPEYELRWKSSDTLLGLTICRLRARERRKSDSGFGGWRSPLAQHANGTPEAFLERKRKAVAKGSSMGICLSDLNMAAQAWCGRMAGWPAPMAGTPAQKGYNEAGNTDSSRKTMELLAGWVSPTAQDHSRGNKPPRPWDTGVPLSQQAALAGWTTPQAHDAQGKSNPDRLTRHGTKHGCRNLNDEAG